MQIRCSSCRHITKRKVSAVYKITATAIRVILNRNIAGVRIGNIVIFRYCNGI